MNLVFERDVEGKNSKPLLRIDCFDKKIYSFVAGSLTIISVLCLEEAMLNVVKQREMNKRNLEEASETLPAEIPSEDLRIETIRNQYQKLKQQYENLGQGLNELEKSLYQQ